MDSHQPISSGIMRRVFVMWPQSRSVSCVKEANENDATLTKIHASDGAPLGTFKVGVYPRGSVFDGTRLWVPFGNPDRIGQLRISNSAKVRSVGTGPSPACAAFDGTSIWVTNFGSNTVNKITP